MKLFDCLSEGLVCEYTWGILYRPLGRQIPIAKIERVPQVPLSLWNFFVGKRAPGLLFQSGHDLADLSRIKRLLTLQESLSEVHLKISYQQSKRRY
jgi:hypothetical protein